MKRSVTIAVAGGLLISLGGCQSVLRTVGLAKDNAPQTASLEGEYAEAQSRYFADRLDAGREDLKNGNFAAAMEQFRHASLGQATRAEALNGLGVAYAGIGRLDLARRYFYQAASLEPEDARFAANIARLHRELDRVDQQVELARQDREAEQASRTMVAQIASQDLARTAVAVQAQGELPAVTSAPAPAPVRVAERPAQPRTRVLAGGAIRVEAPPARINRLSSREVAIVTAPQPETPTQQDYPVRVALSQGPTGDE